MHRIGAFLMPFSQADDKPDSVPLYYAIRRTAPRHINITASIINLHNALPQGVKPPTHSSWPWDWAKSLYGVAAHRDCPFHSELNQLVSVALIVGSPRVAVSHYASHRSPDFPLPHGQLCFVRLRFRGYFSIFLLKSNMFFEIIWWHLFVKSPH